MSKYSENLSQALQSTKTFIFGENNQRLDYLIENFYRLNHERRSLIILASIATGVIFFGLSILFYLIGLFSLQSNLNSAYSNTYSLKELKAPYMAIQGNFDELVNGIKSSNDNLNLNSLLDQKAKELGIQASNFPSKPTITKFTSQSPLAEQFQKESIDFKLTGVSLKKTMEYLNAIEQMPNKLRVAKFRILSITDAKLYFDVLLTVEGLIPEDKQNF
ncbi:hypothetical protein [Silvanigrella aquatica]|uniref:Type II secretion system protein M n=1 Tax=Silvanigrella aquatica TaxID=1915309 RepID=A0A1L4CYI6_9BACT|nr:hypothetical protein [Silvanigrella aquatica]APJ03000.1 hypothetical protein AXG55_03345 [Silvanigrella aquatica]